MRMKAKMLALLIQNCMITNLQLHKDAKGWANARGAKNSKYFEIKW